MMRIYSNSDELYHHGILGQRWGKRNGPPYPLKPDSHSASERKAGWKKSLSSNSDSGEKEDSKLKKLINSKGFKVAMGVTIAAVATYGAYKIGKSHVIGGKKFDKLLAASLKELDDSIDIKELKKIGMSDKEISEGIKQARQAVIDAYAEVRKNYKSLKPNFNSLDDIPKATTDFHSDFFKSKADDAYKILTEGINHGVNESSLGVDLLTGGNRHMNCTMCSSAMAMRMKGYDVSASTSKFGIFSHKVEKWFDGGKFIKPKLTDGREFYDYMLKQGEGHYGLMNISLKSGGQHSIFYVIKNGAIEILDGQMDKSYGKNVSDLSKNLFSAIDLKKTEVMDVTNLKPTKEILKAVTPKYDAALIRKAENASKILSEKKKKLDKLIKEEILPVPKNKDLLNMTKEDIEDWKEGLRRSQYFIDDEDLNYVFNRVEDILLR